MSWTVETTLSRAISAAPHGTRTAFSAYSITLSTGVLASSARVSAALRAAVLRRRAAAAWLRERVAAAFLAVVERFVAAVLRVVAVAVAMIPTPSGQRTCVRLLFYLEHMFVNPRTAEVTP